MFVLTGSPRTMCKNAPSFRAFKFNGVLFFVFPTSDAIFWMDIHIFYHVKENDISFSLGNRGRLYILTSPAVRFGHVAKFSPRYCR